MVMDSTQSAVSIVLIRSVTDCQTFFFFPLLIFITCVTSKSVRECAMLVYFFMHVSVRVCACVFVYAGVCEWLYIRILHNQMEIPRTGVFFLCMNDRNTWSNQYGDMILKSVLVRGHQRFSNRSARHFERNEAISSKIDWHIEFTIFACRLTRNSVMTLSVVRLT